MDEEYKKELGDFIKSMMDDLEKEPIEEKYKKLTYSQLFDEYLIKHGKEMFDDYSDIVPVMFQISTDYDNKNLILEDANKRGILIEESNYYPNILEQHVTIEKETIPSK